MNMQELASANTRARMFSHTLSPFRIQFMKYQKAMIQIKIKNKMRTLKNSGVR